MRKGRVILYADVMTRSIKNAVAETERRRALQQKYNRIHGITPQSIQKEIKDNLDLSRNVAEENAEKAAAEAEQADSQQIAVLEKQMLEAAAELEFEVAAALRDRIKKLKGENS